MSNGATTKFIGGRMDFHAIVTVWIFAIMNSDAAAFPQPLKERVAPDALRGQSTVPFVKRLAVLGQIEGPVKLSRGMSMVRQGECMPPSTRAMIESCV